MAYVTDQTYDIFISYRRIDNQFGWVTRLEETLHKLLKHRAQPGCDGNDWDYSIFRDDHAIDGNEQLNPAVEKAILSSAVLVIVMSDNYATSHDYTSGKPSWCVKERSLFLEKARNTGSKVNRIFIVRMSSIEPDYWPTQLKDLKGYPFWEHDPETNRVVEISFDHHLTGRAPPQCATLAHDIWDALNQDFPKRDRWIRTDPNGGGFERIDSKHWKETPVIPGDREFFFEERDCIRGVVHLYRSDNDRYHARLFSDRAEIHDGDGKLVRHYKGHWSVEPQGLSESDTSQTG